ncbi:MAG: hypothetical protein AAB955_03780 [Patescibacteria group bacterium]
MSLERAYYMASGFAGFASGTSFAFALRAYVQMNGIWEKPHGDPVAHGTLAYLDSTPLATEYLFELRAGVVLAAIALIFGALALKEGKKARLGD